MNRPIMFKGGKFMEMEDDEATKLFDTWAAQQQWPDRDNSRGSGSRYKANDIAALSAKIDALQRALDGKSTVKAVQIETPITCELCGEEGHAYQVCPFAQPNEGQEQVHATNEPQFFSRPQFNQPYLYNQYEQHNWGWRNNSQGGQGSHYQPRNQQPFGNRESGTFNNFGGANRNFYHNAAFLNQNRQPAQPQQQQPQLLPQQPTQVDPLANFIEEQQKMNKMVFDQMQALTTQIAKLAENNQVKEAPESEGQSTSDEAKAIVLRHNNSYEGPSMPPPEPESEPVLTDRTQLLRTVKHPEETVTDEGVEIEMDPPSDLMTHTNPLPSVRSETEKAAEKGEESDASIPKPHQPLVPFPQRLAGAKPEQQTEKFLKTLRQLHIIVPFHEVSSQMPSYAKVLNEILANKTIMEECDIIPLSLKCSAFLTKELPPSLEDPGRITIPCTLGKVKFKEHLGDLGQETQFEAIQQHQAAADNQNKPHGPYTFLTDRKDKLKIGKQEIEHSATGGLQVKGNLLLLDGKLGSLPSKRKLEQSDPPVARKGISPSGEGGMKGGENVTPRVGNQLKTDWSREEGHWVPKPMGPTAKT